MKAALFFSLSLIALSSIKAWPTLKRSFEIYPNQKIPRNIHTISDCMHVASEPGDYIFKKSAKQQQQQLQQQQLVAAAAAAAASASHNRDASALLEAELEAELAAATVCGLYVLGEPDTIVEITMKHYDVNCETGGLMAFVDGWELNGEYFPSIKDHHRPLEERVFEFCNNYKQWPRISNKKFFRSSQNAALLQYRIPTRGSFVANVRFHKITQPCNVLVQDTAAIFNLANYGHARNCTLSALFPAVISLANIRVGGKNVRQEKVNYDCGLFADRLEIGGSGGLESFGMEKASDVCGSSSEPGPEQAIFCGTTNVRLVSTGRFQNQASVVIRKAEENDIELATLACPF